MLLPTTNTSPAWRRTLANEWKPPLPAPRAGITEKDLDRRLSKLCETIGKAVRQMVVEPLQKKIAELEQKQLQHGRHL